MTPEMLHRGVEFIDSLLRRPGEIEPMHVELELKAHGLVFAEVGDTEGCDAEYRSGVDAMYEAARAEARTMREGRGEATEAVRLVDLGAARESCFEGGDG